jgi:colicin import membrane protein
MDIAQIERETAALEKENAAMREAIAEAEAKLAELERPHTQADDDMLASIQARADAVMVTVCERSPAPMHGETPDRFRRRALQAMQRHSPTYKDFDIAHADSAIVAAVEPEIFREVKEAAARGDAVVPGTLVERETDDGSGRKIKRYYGDSMVFLAPFMGGPYPFGRFNQPRERQL